SWLIVLFGAELSFANQNVEKYREERGSLNISHFYRMILTLLTASLVVKNFARGKEPLSAEDIAHELELPIRIVREMIYDLVEVNLFTETIKDNHKERAYQPAFDINNIKISSVILKVDKHGNDDISAKDSSEFRKVSSAVKRFYEKIVDAPEDMLLKEI
ncbi:MAG: YihY/virulence factor BrkB family protein, partial [bacterium]